MLAVFASARLDPYDDFLPSTAYSPDLRLCFLEVTVVGGRYTEVTITDIPPYPNVRDDDVGYYQIMPGGGLLPVCRTSRQIRASGPAS